MISSLKKMLIIVPKIGSKNRNFWVSIITFLDESASTD